MKSLEQLDRWIGGVVKRWSHKVSGGAPAKEILEIRRDILNDVKDKIQPKGGGEYLFPYNEISVHLSIADPARREMTQAAFAEDHSLEQDVRELLNEAGCPVPSGCSLELEITPGEDSFHIDYRRRAAIAKPTPTRPNANLRVTRGEAETPEIDIVTDRVNLGRTKEVMGERGGLRRRNDLAFADTETTVSREHAYIRFDAATGRFRLYDYLSQRETSIFRDGRRIEAPRASTRGVQLQSGDEIHLGDARVRFEIASEEK